MAKKGIIFLAITVVRPVCIQSNMRKSSSCPISEGALPKTKVVVARPNLKQVSGKCLS